MKHLQLLLTVTVLLSSSFQCFRSTNKAQSPQNTLIVHLHLNGYKGNLFYRTGPNWQTYNWFYVSALSGDTTITLTANSNGTFDLYNGRDNVTFTRSGSMVTVNNTTAVTVKADGTAIDANFNVVSINIATNKLDFPYLCTAYALIKGKTNTDGDSFRLIKADTTLTLIKGMYNVINVAQAYMAQQPKCLFSAMPCNAGFAAFVSTTSKPCTGTGYYNVEFLFRVDAQGNVQSDDLLAAAASGNTLTFKTADVNIDPACISNGKPIRLPPYGVQITSKTHFKVIENLIYALRWNNPVQQDMYYVAGK